ncbi:MAG: hypothetical protein Q9186_005196 [Xanthomendoza sp. 1 TL-2023]
MARSTLPETHRALIQSSHGLPLKLSSAKSLPVLRAGQVLVRVHAVALNPTDYKMPANFPTPAAVCGCDFAGEVVAFGPRYEIPDAETKANTLKLGDAVFGCVHGSNPADKGTGSFAEYVAAEKDLVCKVPQDTGWLQAAAWGGIGWSTLGIALWDEERGLGLIWPWKITEAAAMTKEKGGEANRGIYVLVNGGATATGSLAVQLLKLNVSCTVAYGQRVVSAGYTPIVTCSPDNARLLRSLGAVQTFDYNSPSCGQWIRSQTNNRLKYVLDCVADTASVELCFAAMSRVGGRYVCLELPAAGVLGARKAVQWRFVMGYEIFGREIALGNGYGRDGKQGAEHRRRAAKWARQFQVLIDSGYLEGHPLEQLPGSWETSVPAGLDRLMRGGVRGRKLVARIEEGIH